MYRFMANMSMVSSRLSGAEKGSRTDQCSIAGYLAASAFNTALPFTFHFVTSIAEG